MPKEIEKKLEKQAQKEGYTGERKNRYVYGTLNKIKMNRGKKHSHEKKL